MYLTYAGCTDRRVSLLWNDGSTWNGSHKQLEQVESKIADGDDLDTECHSQADTGVTSESRLGYLADKRSFEQAVSRWSELNHDDSEAVSAFLKSGNDRQLIEFGHRRFRSDASDDVYGCREWYWLPSMQRRGNRQTWGPMLNTRIEAQRCRSKSGVPMAEMILENYAGNFASETSTPKPDFRVIRKQMAVNALESWIKQLAAAYRAADMAEALDRV